jgi:excisionase family DNA binding protein
MTKPLVVDKLLYTPVEAAHALGVSRSTLYVLMANGDVPSVRIGSSRRIPADGLRHYIAQLSGPAPVDQPRTHGGGRPEQQHLWK